ncbi:CDP-diacylglycerol--glycerol-3-phosphate 3-phosphatidyltransferase, partial [Streptomyces sp. NPDC006237]
GLDYVKQAIVLRRRGIAEPRAAAGRPYDRCVSP